MIKHFENFRKRENYGNYWIRENVRITAEEVKRAFKKVGKKKAPSQDGMMDLLFQKREWRRLILRIKSENQEANTRNNLEDIE